jgi:GT2 family glycosyltransferase
MDVSIVIASYNTIETTRRCLNSIFEHTKGLEFEVIVVDNNSSDGSAEMIANEFSAVILICNRVNSGFGAAQNSGLLVASGKFLFVLNSDIFFVGNPCKILIDYFSSADNNIGVVGPQILNPDGTVAPSARRELNSKLMIILGQINRHFYFKSLLPSENLMRKHLGWLLSRWHDNYSSHDMIKEVDYVDGMAALFKREALEDSGLFDEQYFFDFEIIDISNRVRNKNWKIMFNPEAQCLHLGHSSRKKLTNIIVETHKSELVFYAKYHRELVNTILKWKKTVIIIKLGLFRFKSLFKSLDSFDKEQIKIFIEILRINDSFKCSDTENNTKIPYLPKYNH